MISMLKIAFPVLVLCLAAETVSAQDMIVNELYNSGVNDEWVELLVVKDSLDARVWSLRDFSAGGTAQGPLVFTTNALWSALRRGTIIVIARPENGFTEDLDPSDHLLVINSNNAAYFSGTAFSFAGTSDALQIRNATPAHVFGVSWGSSNSGSLTEPRVHFAGTLASGATIQFLQGSLPELTQTAAWAFSSSGNTRGTGNGGANTQWIGSLRASADGSGLARVRPDTLSHGDTVPLEVTYWPDTAFAIHDLRIILPSNFVWGGSPTDVETEGMAATLDLAGDTLSFSGVSILSDSARIVITGVTAPDSTAVYPIRVETRGSAAFRPVGPTPTVVVFGLPLPIAQMKENDANGVPIRVNTLMTVRGIVTVANEFGGPSYLQDNSGGMAVFGSDFSTAVQRGDEVVVSGVQQPFGGLSELVNPRLHAIVSSGNHVEPLRVTVKDIATDGAGGIEAYEGLLVRLDGVSVTGSGSWAANTNYPLVQGADTIEVRIDNSTDLVGLPIPGGRFDLVGVVGQYVTSSPYTGGYQILPRSSADLLLGGPIILSFPYESDIQPTSLAISWSSLSPGTSYLRYGRTPLLEAGVYGTDSLTMAHTVRLNALSPATVYYIQAFSVGGGDTSTASTLIACTASPAASTGAVNAYFSSTVNSGVAWYDAATGSADLVSRLLSRITAARRSIDAAFYSLSGTPGPGTDIANALIDARNRGVTVRVVCEQDNRNTAPFTSLVASGIPVLSDASDPVLGGSGLMHNKFVVIDGRGGAAESTWVWTGSWNPTQSGTFNDYQNVVEVQDASLALAYTMEFEEMWGGNGDAPHPPSCRFGARKTDNTPHRFVIGGRHLECWFSPSDRTTSHIITAIRGAEYTVAFNLLTLTRSDIAQALIERKDGGLKVRGVMDNSSDTGSQYAGLLAAGVDVHLKSGAGSTSYLLHHKYGLLDAENPSWNSTVLTGSHNWTNSAENANDENLLVIHDGRIANHFLQEFAARYDQYGGTDPITVGIEENQQERPLSLRLDQNYPNPFNPVTLIRFEIPDTRQVRLEVFDLLGRSVARPVDGTVQAGAYTVRFDGRALASGTYLFRLTSGGHSVQRKMLLLR